MNLTAIKPRIALNKACLIAKPNGSNLKTLETQIDQLVYELYGLTDEEIKIVEGV